jgi:hypothetical protein
MRFWAALILVLTGPSAIQAAPPEMKTIKDFMIANANATNGGTEVFVGLRCSSLYAIMKTYTLDNNMKDASEKFAIVSDTALKFAAEHQDPYNEGYLLGQIEIMTNSYVERFLTAKARTGNFGDDEVIKSDINTCGEIF